jgi:hypothetical protein
MRWEVFQSLIRRELRAWEKPVLALGIVGGFGTLILGWIAFSERRQWRRGEIRQPTFGLFLGWFFLALLVILGIALGAGQVGA